MSFRSLPIATRLYVALLVLAGLAAGIGAVDIQLLNRADIALVIYMVLAMGTAKKPVKIPYTDVHFSVDTPFVFVILIQYGLLPALIADVAAKFILTFFNVRREAYYKIPFNMASGAVSVFGAYFAYVALFFKRPTSSVDFILPIIGVTMAYYLINTLSVALAICITQRKNVIVFWIKNFLPTGIGFLASGSIATLIWILHNAGNYLGLVVIVPFVFLIYFAQKTYLQKETEAQNHIYDLESMHLSTIQSLSLVLDAKDEYTHGHVHRVTNYAVALAKKMGVTDEKILKGIAFAGLVHDIGKIAIPDAILNKPGKYIEAENSRMKIHPIIGAEILRNIPSDLPIDLIVRHHHEKWNGKGYPDRLSGEYIPFESRILAVADVYDAIRSDRPYRPKMDKDRAIKIMESEKGQCLDPVLVTVFLENLEEFEANIDQRTYEPFDNKIQDIVKASYLSSGDEPGRPASESDTLKQRRELNLFRDLSALFTKGETLSDKLQELASIVAKSIPHTALVVYLPEFGKKRLVPGILTGLDVDILHHNILDIGNGVSGWVFANKTPMVATPPPSEFSGLVDDHIPYQSILSVPLVSVDNAAGTVTLYSENKDAFTAEDQDLLIKISPIVGPLIQNLVGEQGIKWRIAPCEKGTQEKGKGKTVIYLPNVSDVS